MLRESTYSSFVVPHYLCFTTHTLLLHHIIYGDEITDLSSKVEFTGILKFQRSKISVGFYDFSEIL